MKVDVAIQSYKKPESLLYTLMTLKEHCEELIDNVFINDDCSNDDTIAKYTAESVKKYFANWNIYVRENKKNVGWKPSYVFGYFPRYLKVSKVIGKIIQKYTNTGEFFQREDMRYQWALDKTDKKYLFIIHDDVEFKQNILQKYVDYAESLTKPAIVGDLGQCWRCPYQNEPFFCNPTKIMNGDYSTNIWPLTDFKDSSEKRSCRINEWCCLISVKVTKDILQKERAFFGNYDDKGDIGAYWFERAIVLGYSFGDPLPNQEDRQKYYIHGWQGHSGHSVWVDQGSGKKIYTKETIQNRMKDKYGLVLP